LCGNAGIIAAPVEHPEGARFNWAGKEAQNAQMFLSFKQGMGKGIGIWR